MLVVGIAFPLPQGVQYKGKFQFIEPKGGKWAREACAECPKQRYAREEPSKAQGQDRKGIVEWSCGYRARLVSIRGNFVLSRNSGYKTRRSPCG